MTAREIIRAQMDEKGYSYASLAEKLGTTPSTISDRVTRRTNGMRIDVLLEMLNAMDCEIIIKDKIGKKRTYILDNKKEEEE